MQIYKTFWRRVAALFIDNLVMSPLIALSFFMMWRGVSSGTYCLVMLFGTVVSSVYWIGMHGRFGQTLGKMAAGVKVLKMDDQPICYGVATKRYFPLIVVALITTIGMWSYLSGVGQITFQSVQGAPKWTNWVNWIWTLAQLITLLSNPMRRAIHDFIAGTKVVVVQKDLPPPIA